MGYLVELGANRLRVVRMSGGINAWKRQALDGIFGDLRPMYAGKWQTFSEDSLSIQEGDRAGQTAMCVLDETTDVDNVPYGARNTVLAGSMPQFSVGCKVQIVGMESR